MSRFTTRCLTLLVAVAAVIPRPAAAQQDGPAPDGVLTLADLEGSWMGALKVGDRQGPRVGVRILRKADGSMGASAASVDQGADFIPAEASLEGPTLTVRLHDPRATIEGKVVPDSGRIEAEFRQGEAALSLTLERVDELPPAGPVRPQTPRPPFPYETEEIRVHNEADDVWLAGTLSKPEGPGPHPGIVFVAGSGPQDRGVLGTGGHETGTVIADHLTKRGFAVLRYDKRGVYESSGSYGDATEADFTRDAAAAHRYMVSREDVRSDRVGFVGHSEGSLVAARAAAAVDGPVGFIVSMAGPGLPMFDVLVLQDGTQAAAEGATDREVELIREFSRRYYRTAMETEGEGAREEALAALYDSLDGERAAAMERYFPDRPGTLDPGFAARQAFVDDLEADPPATWWKQVRAPVLVLNGGKDSQVPAEENVGAIVEALEQAPTERLESRIFPDKNHLFQTATSGAVDEYEEIDQTIAPEVLEHIAGWLDRVGPSSPAGLGPDSVTIEPGSGTFPVAGGEGREERTLTVHYHRPESFDRRSPVVVVVPGAGRNADDYRDAWIEASERHGLLVLSPHYPERHYPEYWSYNLAGMTASVTFDVRVEVDTHPEEWTLDDVTREMASREVMDLFGHTSRGHLLYRLLLLERAGMLADVEADASGLEVSTDRADWILADFDRIFEKARQELGLERDGYDMFGHSAGGQILHRYVLFHPDNRADRVLAANSGWYTLPTGEEAFPYGLEGTGLSTEELEDAFRERLVVFLGGEDDRSETRGQLRRTPAADRQGPGRRERGEFFYRQARETAREVGVDLNWRIEVVPGVGHEYRRMSAAAAEYLYGGQDE